MANFLETSYHDDKIKITLKRVIPKTLIYNTNIDLIKINGDLDFIYVSLFYCGNKKYNGKYEFIIKPTSLNELYIETEEVIKSIKSNIDIGLKKFGKWK